MTATDRRTGLVLAAIAGLVLGVATQLGQSILPAGVGQLANSISPWLSVAFAVGAVQSTPRNAGFAGLLSLLMALVGYYVLVFARFGYTGGTSSLVLWGVASICGGPALGAAGWFWRHGSVRARAISAALLGGVWVAEAAYLFIVLSMPTVALGYAAVGLGVPMMLGRNTNDRLLALAAMVPIIGLGGLGFVAFMTLQTVLADLR